MTPWHMAHRAFTSCSPIHAKLTWVSVGGIFTRGPGLTFIEATAVVPEGRITPQDLGLWNDAQVDSMRQIVEFAHSQNQKVAIQLAHAGRKASTVAPWLHAGLSAPESDGGWPENVVSASDLPYNDLFPQPKGLTKEGIRDIVSAFAAAAKRSLKAGIDVIEIHGAHGYLIYQFLSPQTNQRTDDYGGSWENRTRLAVEIVDAVRAVIPDSMPLFFR
jgi:2,4-dienoyl-CoA reductase-like NADH-dependent reductase (Old Yellow Enzyme family)